jgi:hypothetical protein
MAQQVRDIRECEKCRAEMQPMGKLPPIGGKPLVKVFGCFWCNRIESETLHANKSAPACVNFT